MRIDRKVIARKDQLLVAIPAAVRDHLGVVGGARVYWHVAAKGSAALTASGRYVGGRPRADADCSSCGKYRAELLRVRNLLRGSHVGDYNTAFGQGYMQGVKSVPIWRGGVDRLYDEMHDVRGLLAGLVVRLGPRGGRPRKAAPSPGAPDVSPSIPDPPSPGAIDGGAEASGAEPPGLPL